MDTTQTSLDEFVTRLIEEKGLNGLDAEVLEQVTQDLRSRVEDRINAKIVSALPETELPAFSKILEDGTEEQVLAFCAEHIPDMDNLVASELLAFRETYVAG
jgi:Protein of unknown function (DUF5663)